MKEASLTKEEWKCLAHIRKRLELVSEWKGPAPIGVTIDLSTVINEHLSCSEVGELLLDIECRAKIGGSCVGKRKCLFKEIWFRLFVSYTAVDDTLMLYKNTSLTWRDIMRLFPDPPEEESA